ncbi:hypothetical protein GJ744_010610 [Endocarpon pusillum]|uniref:Aldehyde dehydrogenase domain-containing protein n=1 Tax=Endocarpon pusillum TaxID=364733 RepID=A0A8H7ATE5_9EURO|nr:hypothetical protein GJ744_010610 [Endocarpon pusillum]
MSAADLQHQPFIPEPTIPSSPSAELNATTTQRSYSYKELLPPRSSLSKAASIETINTISVVGDQWQESPYQGSQLSKAQYDRVLSYVKAGKEEEATLAMGGEPCPINGKGYYIKPTVFTDVKDSMRIYHEEVFGPFVVISQFEDEQEAISRANSTSYGLSASVFTNDLERAHRVAAEIEAGMVLINSSQDCDFRLPFGGVKQNGIG